MIPSLRKKHRIIWIILAIILPIIFILAVMGTPETVVQQELFQEPSEKSVNHSEE